MPDNRIRGGRMIARVVLGALLVGFTPALVAVAAPSPAYAAASCTGNVSVYGVLADGRMTYSAIDPDNGNLAHVVASTRTLGFTPVAMATLNFNTVLITSTAGDLYRVDISTNDESLVFNTPVKIFDQGWTHEKLTYDGHGHLYGIAGGHLLQYVVSQPKPAGAAHLAQRVDLGKGFVLKTLAAAGDDRLVATASDGRLIGYRITGNTEGAWNAAELDNAGWSAFTHLLSPGGGLYYGRTSNGAMYWYEDDDPTDGSGADIAYHNGDPVNTRGWTQTLLSAQPGTCTASATGTGNTMVEKAIRIAVAQVAEGDPYVWAAEGPDAFDCSGLVWYSYYHAGYSWGRTDAEHQYNYGTRYSYSARQRGDLLFWSSNGAQSGIHHVAIYLGGNQIVEAANSKDGLQTGAVHTTSELMPYVVRLAG